MNEDMTCYRFKMILIGNTSTGKTSFLEQLRMGTITNYPVTTIGVDCWAKSIIKDSSVLKVQIWDTSGQERFRSITASYYYGVTGVVIMYDITNRESFVEISKWIKDFHDHYKTKEGSVTSPAIMIVGNKCDLVDRRKVSHEEGLNYATEKGYQFHETSALTGDEINETFLNLVNEMYLRRLLEERKSKPFDEIALTADHSNHQKTLQLTTVSIPPTSSSCSC